MACVNACPNEKILFHVKPEYDCGHLMCFNSGMAIDWCIKCGCKTRIEASFCDEFNELLEEDDDKEPAKQ